MLDKLTVTISRTAQGNAFYMQIASESAIPVNIVLVASEIEVCDSRKQGETNADAQ